ncbi:glycosyltransferase family 4 protein [Cohnella nanjingensis]|uniref:Glycosyltransferase family 4 protein n=1 Tax=Cohnella nanjingensis TaxID=1387779 RepID=A0A7X0RL81_9BACL|nr:glycosyltransferase family 4 protein [Cohnella nanjingensis]MBB6669396.1 glycosyltransferase family 4 protein [Cohnella nanjingensis]
MKILLATYWHVPHLGGVWGYMVQLREKLESLGHEVDLLGYGDEAGSFVHIVNKNKKLQSDKLLPLLQAMLNPSNYPAIYHNELVKYTEFRRYVFELSVAYFGLDSYDVVHTQDVISTAAIQRIRPERTALVASLHGCVAHEIRMQLKTVHKSATSEIAREYYNQLEYIGATSAEITVVANQWLKNILTDEFRVPSDRMKVIHYGYDIGSFLKQLKTKSTVTRPPNKKVILYSGRLVELKGVQHLLDALGKLKDKRKDWICWIVGDGDMRLELDLQCKVLRLEKDVVFLGKRDDVPSLMAQADIFVLPSMIENQPLSVIEAQLAGKAIIASNVGGLPEIIKHKDTGLLVPPGDVDKLYKYLDRLLADDALRRNLGSRANQWAKSYWSLDVMADQIVGVYQSAIEKRRLLSDDRHEQEMGQV